MSPASPLAWLLTRPFVTSVIIGAKTREQLADNLAAATSGLPPSTSPSSTPPARCLPEYPAWMIDRQNQNRRPPTP